jgi:hypothetical protein
LEKRRIAALQEARRHAEADAEDKRHIGALEDARRDGLVPALAKEQQGTHRTGWANPLAVNANARRRALDSSGLSADRYRQP